MMKKDMVLSIIRKIADMGRMEIEDYAKTIAMSNIDSKARGFIDRAIKIKQDTLASSDISLEVICSDIDADGGDYD